MHKFAFHVNETTQDLAIMLNDGTHIDLDDHSVFVFEVHSPNEISTTVLTQDEFYEEYPNAQGIALYTL